MPDFGLRRLLKKPEITAEEVPIIAGLEKQKGPRTFPTSAVG